jgi:hypothetical protein
MQLQFFKLLMMGGVSPETCWASKKHWNNKFYYTVAYCWFFLWDLITKNQVTAAEILEFGIFEIRNKLPTT